VGHGGTFATIGEAEHLSVYQDRLHMSVYKDRLHMSVYQDRLHMSVYQDSLHMSVYKDRLHMSVYQDSLHMSVYQDRLHMSVPLHIYILIYLLTPWNRVVLEKLTGSQLDKKFPHFVEHEGSLQRLQKPTTYTYPEPDQSSHIPLPEDPC
jgi:hypothetical protein